MVHGIALGRIEFRGGVDVKKTNFVAFIPFYLLVVILVIAIAGAGSGAVTAIGQNTPVARRHRIIIDAGHGGIDGGATSCTGVLESHLNLEIALRLRDVCQLLGLETVMIRTTDTSIYTQGNTIAAQKVSDLKERVRICNETEGAVLVSIHQNTFSSSRYSGAQVFYADTPGSDLLARALQQSIPGSRESRQAKGVYLMEHIQVPGVLMECGFLSNPAEEQKLRSPEYQKFLVCAVACTLSTHLSSVSGTQ